MNNDPRFFSRFSFVVKKQAACTGGCKQAAQFLSVTLFALCPNTTSIFLALCMRFTEVM